MVRLERTDPYRLWRIPSHVFRLWHWKSRKHGTRKRSRQHPKKRTTRPRPRRWHPILRPIHAARRLYRPQRIDGNPMPNWRRPSHASTNSLISTTLQQRSGRRTERWPRISLDATNNIDDDSAIDNRSMRPASDDGRPQKKHTQKMANALTDMDSRRLPQKPYSATSDMLNENSPSTNLAIAALSRPDDI